jgi:hypothetical protein
MKSLKNMLENVKCQQKADADMTPISKDPQIILVSHQSAQIFLEDQLATDIVEDNATSSRKLYSFQPLLYN